MTSTVQSNEAERDCGLVAEFEDVDAILAAANSVREAGYKKWECYTPFPVHGLDKAMGAKPTILPWIVLACGTTGATLGLLLQWWTNTIDYPYIISGKPFFSLPANIPIIFELTILLSAFGAVFGMLGLNAAGQFYHPLFKLSRFARVTDDRFFLAIESTDGSYDPQGTRSLLESLGATAVEEVKD